MAIVTISYSELTTARQCPLKHELSYVDRWSRPQPPDSALYKGTYWHRALEAHYLYLRECQKKKIKPSMDVLLARVEQSIERAADKIKELIWWMYRGYVDQYGFDDRWQILAVEHPAEVRLRTPSGRPSNFILKMKIDLIIRDLTTRTKNIEVVDHKSGKDLPKARVLELDDQFGLYTWGLRQMKKRVFGQMYNAARTYRTVADQKEPGAMPLKERFDRINLYRTDKELDQVALEAYLTAQARYYQQRMMNKAGIRSPRHTNPQDCNWKCDFLEACMAGRKGMDMRRFLLDQGFTTDHTRH